MDEDDDTLLGRVRAGDREAAAVLVTRHADRVFRYAHALASEADADDVAQEALIAALGGIGAVRDARAIPSWLFAVTRTAGNRMRRSRRSSEALDDRIAASGGPEEDATRHELAGALTQGLAGLDPKQREVLWLRDVEGFTAPEVAEALDLHVDAVKTRLHRARTALRRRISPGSEHGPACPDIEEKFSSFLEGDVGHAECEQLQAHVATCASCNAACASLRRSVAACNAHRDTIPADLQARVRRALAGALGRA